jgi:deoxyribonuclease-1
MVQNKGALQMYLMKRLLVLIMVMLTSTAFADEITFTSKNWGGAKKAARDQVYFDHKITIYCGCRYSDKGSCGGVIDHQSCGYKVRGTTGNAKTRAARLEWEHVVPASLMPARQRGCWTTGHPSCAKANRKCCETTGVDETARKMIFDLHNLTPSVGQVNGDRSNFRYGVIEGEERVYGACDFEVSKELKLAEPQECQRGNLARVWLYMNWKHGVKISAEEKATFLAWSIADPVSSWEKERDKRIKGVQGNSNPFVENGIVRDSGKCQWEQ